MPRPGLDSNGARVSHRNVVPEDARTGDFGAFAGRVRPAVENELAEWLDRRMEEARGRGADVEVVASAITQLALRGGKRIRAVLAAAAFEACGGEGGPGIVARAGVALELLQTYLLVHDDWMDGDDVRRGGPSVPAMMRARFDGARADAMTILAGDLAAAWSRRALLEVAMAPDRLVLAAAELARVEEDVVEGQVLDVGGRAQSAKEVEMMHRLKASSYTVRGPIAVGARLAGATEGQVSGLTEFAEPLGVAFQLRDDLLGVFGNAEMMGKPAGNDLRAGKRSAVVVEAQRAGLIQELGRVLGRRDATAGDVQAAISLLEVAGVRTRIEARIGVLVGEAQGALERTTLTSTGRALLAGAAYALTDRQT
jgi:geranylgeranyl diphosphate synthase, type I